MHADIYRGYQGFYNSRKDWMHQLTHRPPPNVHSKHTKALALAIVSHCHASNCRRLYLQQLIKAVEYYGFTVDSFGECMVRPNSNYLAWVVHVRPVFCMVLNMLTSYPLNRFSPTTKSRRTSPGEATTSKAKNLSRNICLRSRSRTRTAPGTSRRSCRGRS